MEKEKEIVPDGDPKNQRQTKREEWEQGYGKVKHSFAHR